MRIQSLTCGDQHLLALLLMLLCMYSTFIMDFLNFDDFLMFRNISQNYVSKY